MLVAGKALIYSLGILGCEVLLPKLLQAQIAKFDSLFCSHRKIKEV